MTQVLKKIGLGLLAGVGLGLLNACQLLPIQLLTAGPGRNYYLPPEYEPVQGMIVSDHLAEFNNGNELLSTLLNAGAEVWLLSSNQELLTQTRSVLSQRFGLQAEQMQKLRPLPVATESVWARDWAPLFSYSSHYPGELGLVDYRYYAERPLDDGVPAALVRQFGLSGPEPGVKLATLPVEVELEGGNVLCTRKNCFVSEEVLRRIEENSGKHADAQVVRSELEKYLEQDFWLVPRMPFESTGHLDIWTKLLDAKTLIIGQISAEGLEAVPEELKATYSDVSAFLEEQATGFDAEGKPSPRSLAAQVQRLEPGIKIVRIPMPTPGIYQGIETFRTYTNSLLYNGLAIVPRYVRGQRNLRAQRDLMLEQEQAVEKVYQQAGYRISWIRADNLIRDGGAWHCVAMQIPKLKQ
ncbi:MAG: agmatine deiminase family protein [Candidatus Sericytochromatia bacterium]